MKRLIKKKGQISVEFALLIGFITFLLLATIGIAYYYSGSAKNQIKVNSIDKVGKKIADTADSICFLGPPSKATIRISIPEGVQEAILLEGPESEDGMWGINLKTVIKGEAVSDMIYETQCELTDNNPSGGDVTTSLEKQGIKSISFTAERNTEYSSIIYVEMDKSS